MPRVGKTHYPYSAKGKAAAKAAAKKRGVKVGYNLGGDTSTKGKKEPVLDKKSMRGKKPPTAVIIAMNKGGKVKRGRSGKK